VKEQRDHGKEQMLMLFIVRLPLSGVLSEMLHPGQSRKTTKTTKGFGGNFSATR
jgi:hypothetical protein